MSVTATDTTGTTAPPPASRWIGVGSRLLRVRELSVLVVNIALIVYFGAVNPAFFSSSNISNIANFFSAVALIAAGETFLLICGEIDLSAGMTFAVVPVIMVTLNGENGQGMPLWLAMIISLIAAAVIGLFNGLVTQFLKLPSFITTLGTLYVLHGISLTLAGSTPLPAPEAGAFSQIFGGWSWSELIWTLVIVVVMQIVLTQTRWGAHTIATGANVLGASESGIKVRQIKIRAFVITALFAGFAGILDGTNIAKSFDPNAGGNDLMFMAVAASVIGGTALLGGSGTVIGAALGALLLAVLQDGFNIQGISATTFVIVEGIAILLAMALNTWLARFRTRAREQ
ncbi:MAG TPA: ABC transporter permease [Microbacteriaceae bacterium]